MVISQEIENGLVKTMWLKAGIQSRGNTFILNGVPFEKKKNTIDIHSHDYDHIAMDTYGWFEVTEITKDGEKKVYQIANRGYTPKRTDIPFNPIGYYILIPAYHRHEFRLLEETEIPAEILCMWGSDGSEDHHGC